MKCEVMFLGPKEPKCYSFVEMKCVLHCCIVVLYCTEYTIICSNHGLDRIIYKITLLRIKDYSGPDYCRPLIIFFERMLSHTGSRIHKNYWEDIQPERVHYQLWGRIRKYIQGVSKKGVTLEFLILLICALVLLSTQRNKFSFFLN